MASGSIGSQIGQALDEAITEIHSIRDELSAKLQRLTDWAEGTLATQADIQTRVKSLEDVVKTLGASEALQDPASIQKHHNAGATKGVSREGGSSTVANPPVFVKPTPVPRKRRRRDEHTDAAANGETQELVTQPLSAVGSDRGSTTASRAGDIVPAMNEAVKRGESDRTAKKIRHAAIDDTAPTSLPSSSTLRASPSAPLLTKAAAQHDKPSAMEVHGPVSATDSVSKMEKDMWRPSWLGAGKPGSLEDYIRERRTVIHGKDQGRETRTSTQEAVRTSVQIEKANHPSIPNTNDGDDDDDDDDENNDIRYDQPAAKRVRQPTTRKPKAAKTTRLATPQDPEMLDAPSLKTDTNDTCSHSHKGNSDTTTATTKAPSSGPAPRKATPAKAAKPPATKKKPAPAPAPAPTPARKRAPAKAADAGAADENGDAASLLAAFQAQRDGRGGKE